VTEAVTLEQREKLAELFQELSRTAWWEDIRHDDMERALILVDEIIKAGWTPPMPPVPEEEWRDIPGFSYWQMSNRGFVRYKMSHVQVEVSVHNGERVMVTIHDDMGYDAHVSLDELQLRTWPKKTEDLEEPESFAEEWKDIEAFPGLTSFQVSNYGRIRYKFNDRIHEPVLDEKTGRMGVPVILNGKSIFIDGPALAAAMWDKTTVEWRNIPGFSGYIISQEGGVMLADGPMDLHATPVPPLYRHVRPRSYNLLGDDNRGHEKTEHALVALAFPEQEL
jgi:hypothetical protein